MSDKKGGHQRWFPLESNPTLMTDYVQKLGFDTSLYEFYDVFSTEDWALQMIPQPVSAVVFLYPLTEKQTAFEKEEQQQKAAPESTASSPLWFIKQRIGNACGTIGLLHAVLNGPEALRFFAPGSWLQQFYHDCPPALDSLEKAKRLEGDDKIATLHDQATSSDSNATGRGALEDKLITHFVALVYNPEDQQLYEMDGRKKGPVCHGPTTPTTFLKDACQNVVQKFMDRDPSEMRFTILALAPSNSDKDQSY
eukprot:CAMPEP_0198142704 /NCGR_PEP_ID=MMETSP1443-20131203/5428_1 /TAXON_ID=186043 /ORGANISM="Entomoneis sp., Strain CCMP2396" /LENGTH=251 /DNA_ID=CAMNT_0043805781 /DNA_START=148 /DNA_END=903 /DNA_ORIENTATION=+